MSQTWIISAGWPHRLSLLWRPGAAVVYFLLRHPGRALAAAVLLLLAAVGLCTAGVYLWSGHHLRAARAALDRYHTREALPHLEVCLKLRPRDPETLFLAARTARRLGTFGEADHYLDEYQEVRGKDDEDLILERVLVRAERGAVDEVIKFCRALVEQGHPAAPLILEALAHGCLRMYRLHEADTYLERWLQQQPDNPQALLLQGQVRDQQERRLDALASYRRALEADAELDEARSRLAVLLVTMGQGGEALPHLEYLRRRDPDNPSVQVYRARALDLLGRTGEAETALDEVLARYPHHGAALTARGSLALRAEGQSADAERWLRQAAELEPGDYQAHYLLHQALTRNGKTEEAEQEQERLKRVEDDLKRIQEIATVKLQMAPHDPALHCEAGVIALRAGAVAEGLRWLHSALKEDPRYAPAHRALMEHYQRTGDAGRAAYHRARAEGRP
jgi:predicted Zn-dependent protease